MIAPRLRILSDLHFGDERSALRDLTALTPLLEGVDELVLNGDTCDTQHDLGPQELKTLKQFFQSKVRSVTFLTGNHDPDIGPTHELSLADGAVWLTHGDVFFDDIAPWSRLQPEMLHRLTQLRTQHSAADWQTITTRLPMLRAACTRLPCEKASALTGCFAKLERAFRDLFPPHRAVAMLRAWLRAPSRAADLVREQRPSARFVIFGHIHFPGVWQREGRIVINTGSFAPPLGARLVDLIGNRLQVRTVLRREESFHPGKLVAEFPLA